MAIRNTDLGGNDWSDGSTLLDGAITDSDTTITVDSTADFNSTGSFMVDAEVIDYTGTTATTFTGCTRGTHGTTAASHLDNAVVDEKEFLTHTDLNDTFDAAFAKIQTLSTFWMNSELYTVYDDFDSYSLGSFPTNSEWTVSTATSGGGAGMISTVDIVSSTNAGGASQEIKLYAAGSTSGTSGTGTTSITSIGLAVDKHKHFKLYADLDVNRQTGASSNAITLTFDSTTVTIASTTLGSTATSDVRTLINQDISIIAKGSDTYDVYIGGKKVISDATPIDPQIKLEVTVTNTGTQSEATLYIDDVVESTGTI